MSESQDELQEEPDDKKSNQSNSKKLSPDNGLNSGKELERHPSIRRKLRTLAFGSHHKSLPKENSKKRKSSWSLRLNCRARHNINTDVAEPTVGCSSCICTGYRRTDEHHLGAGVVFKASPPSRRRMSTFRTSWSRDSQNNVKSVYGPVIDLSRFNPDDYPIDDWDERARQERAREIEEGVEPPPDFHPITQSNNNEYQLSDLTVALQQQLSLTFAPYPYLERLSETTGFAQGFFRVWDKQGEGFHIVPTVHTQIDYIHCLVPDLLQITNCSFYWGKMDRYEAEKLLENKPEGTFLLRDSAQEEYLFSVSFRRYGRSLHARIEQWNHKFSFDSHDPGVFASRTVCGLIEHYKDPSSCMFFDPMLTIPLYRTFSFSLQHLCRSVISNHITYDGINRLRLPKRLKIYLKEYHYKQRVRVRRFDVDQ